LKSWFEYITTLYDKCIKNTERDCYENAVNRKNYNSTEVHSCVTNSFEGEDFHKADNKILFQNQQ